MNENSDTWVVKQLGEELMPEFRRLRREEQLGWTQIMNRQMRSLWEKGVSEKTREESTHICVSLYPSMQETHVFVAPQGDKRHRGPCILQLVFDQKHPTGRGLLHTYVWCVSAMVGMAD